MRKSVKGAVAAGAFMNKVVVGTAPTEPEGPRYAIDYGTYLSPDALRHKFLTCSRFLTVRSGQRGTVVATGVAEGFLDQPGKAKKKKRPRFGLMQTIETDRDS
jgi:hypothetical protein